MLKIILRKNKRRKGFAWVPVAVWSLIGVCLSCSFIYAGEIAKENPSSQKGRHLLSTDLDLNKITG